MNNRKAYQQVNATIKQNYRTLQQMGENPTELFEQWAKHIGLPVKQWAISDFDALEQAVLHTINIYNTWRPARQRSQKLQKSHN